MPTLKELQEQIDRNNELLANSTPETNGIIGITEERKKLEATLQQRRQELDSKIKELETQVGNAPKENNEILGFFRKLVTAETEAEKLERQLTEAQAEIADYDSFITAKVQKIEEEAQNKLLSYQEQKGKLFDITDGLLADSDNLNSILAPLTSAKPNKEEISFAEAAQSIFNAVTFGVKNAGTISAVLSSRDFYQQEFVKANKTLAGKEKYDPQNPPFFLQLLKDKDTKEFLQQKAGPKLDVLIEKIMPTMVNLALNRTESLGKWTGVDEQTIQNMIIPTRDQLEKIGFNSEHINQKMMPIVTSTIKALVSNSDNFMEIANHLVDRNLNKEEAKKYNNAPIIASIGEIVSNEAFKKILTTDIPAYLQENQDLLVKATSIVAPQLLSATLPASLNHPDVLEVMTPIALELAAKTLPLASELVVEGLANNAQELTTLYQNVGKLTSEELSVAERSKLITSIAGDFAKVLNNEQINKILVTDVPDYLTSNKQLFLNTASIAVPTLLAMEVNNEPLLSILANQEVMGQAIDLTAKSMPIAANAVNAALVATPQLLSIYNNITKITSEKNLSPNDRDTSISNILKDAKSLVSDKVMQDLLKHDLPEYLKTNQADISKLIDKAVEQPAISSLLEPWGITPEIAKSASKIGTDLLIDALPIAAELGKYSLEDQAGLKNIINAATNAINPSKGKEMENLNKLLNTLIEFKDNNQKVDYIIGKKIPDLLLAHSESLGNLTQDYLNNTGIGESLSIQGKELLQATANHLPQVMEIAESYTKGDYSTLIKQAIKLIATDKEVRTLAVKAGVSIIKNKLGIGSSKTPSSLEEDIKKPPLQTTEHDQQELKEAVEIMRNNVKIPDEKKQDYNVDKLTRQSTIQTPEALGR